mmetsp:Transcript_51548/g.81806  ORF Transcript_51548/g.81806 Transcript_51548/m.81806 type:complete len:206 (+) Transcript_51548:839-1456(+)
MLPAEPFSTGMVAATGTLMLPDEQFNTAIFPAGRSILPPGGGTDKLPAVPCGNCTLPPGAVKLTGGTGTFALPDVNTVTFPAGSCMLPPIGGIFKLPDALPVVNTVTLPAGNCMLPPIGGTLKLPDDTGTVGTSAKPVATGSTKLPEVAAGLASTCSEDDLNGNAGDADGGGITTGRDDILPRLMLPPLLAAAFASAGGICGACE